MATQINLFFLLSPLLLLEVSVESLANGNLQPFSDSETSTHKVVLKAAQHAQVATKPPASTPCVFDQITKLTWEVKTNDGGIQDAQQSYSWFEPDTQVNGGFEGYRHGGKCNIRQCNTYSYVKYINQLKLCGYTDWRLPTREELRTLVDYSIPYPGPVINQKLFPNAVSQFYWSATPSASDKEAAWGIGFAFGFDYAYFKSDHGYVRLVRGPEK